MHFSASLLTEAMRPVAIVIGRTTYVARPISTPQMLRLQAATVSGDSTRQLVAFAETLRAAFPRRRWRDPVKIILGMRDSNTAKRDAIVKALFRVPGSTDDRRLDESPLEQMRREQRAAVHGSAFARGPAPTLATASVVVRAAYGDTWYYNPARWNTADGYAPFPVTWVEYVGLLTLDAKQRLSMADAMSLSMASDVNKAQRARQELLKQAFPPDRMMS